MKYNVHFFRFCKVSSVDGSLTLTVVHKDFPSSLYSMLYPIRGPFKLAMLGVYNMNLTSGRKNVMSMRELFFPDPLAGFEKMAGFQIFYCLKIKCFHS